MTFLEAQRVARRGGHRLVDTGCNYVQNYILQQAAGTDFARSSAATTLVVLIEVFVSLMGVAVIDLGSWSA